MRTNRIRRLAAISATAALIAVVLGSVPAGAVVAGHGVAGHEVAAAEAAEAKAAKDKTAEDKTAEDGKPADGKADIIVQDGTVTAPVVTTDGEDGREVTLFKVTDAEHTLVWVATAGEAVVVEGGVRVAPSTIAQGDRITVSGPVDDKGKHKGKGTATTALKVLIHDAA